MLLLIASLHKHALAAWPKKRWKYYGKSDLCFLRRKEVSKLRINTTPNLGHVLAGSQTRLFLEVTYRKQPTAKMRHFGTPLPPRHFFNILC